MVLSTEDHQELMQNVADKCAAQFSLIPSVHRISSHESVHDHSQVEEIALEKGYYSSSFIEKFWERN